MKTRFVAGISLLLIFLLSASSLADDPGTWWVFLKTRQTDRATRQEVLNGLSVKARERRLRTLGQVVLESDLPPSYSSVRQVSSMVTQVLTVSRWLNAVSVVATREQIEAVAKLPDVREIRRVSVQQEIRPLPVAPSRSSSTISVSNDLASIYGSAAAQIHQIKVDSVHMMGYTGNGVTVAFLDSGFPRIKTHNAFKHLDIVDTLNAVTSSSADPNPASFYGDSHGSLVVSTVVASDTGKMVGVAPNISVLLARTEDNTGGITTEYPEEEIFWVNGLEWAEAHGADLVSTSLGYRWWAEGGGYLNSQMDGNTAVTTIAADAAAARGLLVVASAGNNSGSSPVADTTINAPADGDSVLAVGAVDANGARAYFSSQGPTADGRIKPDVVALGLHAALVNVANDTDYASANGTSFSAPLVAGVVALMLEANPYLQPMDIITILHETSSHAADPSDSVGYGLVDAKAAVLAALDLFGSTEEPTTSQPEQFNLSQVWPNPTNGLVRMRLETNDSGSGELALYDLLGRLVMRRSLVLTRGANSLELTLDGVASGVYLVRVDQRGSSQVRRITLLR